MDDTYWTKVFQMMQRERLGYAPTPKGLEPRVMLSVNVRDEHHVWIRLPHFASRLLMWVWMRRGPKHV